MQYPQQAAADGGGTPRGSAKGVAFSLLTRCHALRGLRACHPGVARSLVPEMAFAREDHRDLVLVAGGDDLIIAT